MAVITATITKVVREEGNDWVRIHTDHDTVKQLDTKDPSRIQQAVGAKGSEVGIQYTHRPSRNINPYTNQPYDNYYFDGIVDTPSANGDSGVEVVPKPAATTRQTDPKDAWRISLAAGAKLAVATLPLMDEKQPKDFETQKRIALAWGKWLFQTPPPAGAAQPEDVLFGPEPSNPLDDPPPYIDDDWPKA